MRQHTRHRKTAFAWYGTITASPDEMIEGICYSADVSQGGLGMTAKDEVQVGTLLLVEIALGKERLSAVCRSVYCSVNADGSYRLGLRFVTVPPNGRHLLSKHFG